MSILIVCSLVSEPGIKPSDLESKDHIYFISVYYFTVQTERWVKKQKVLRSDQFFQADARRWRTAG
jgi:hypothetical protein